MPVTVIVLSPTGVDAAVVMVMVVPHAGEQLAGLNVAVAPVGRPAAVKLTACVVPEDRVAVIVFVVDDPCVTDALPPLPRAKLKDAAVLRVA